MDSHVVEFDNDDDDEELRVTLQDTPGDEEYDRMRPLAYVDADLVLVCFAMNDAGSLRSINGRWITEVRHLLPATPIILVGTKADLKVKVKPKEGEDSAVVPKVPEDLIDGIDELNFVPECQRVSSQQGKYLSWDIKAEGFVECSAKDGSGIIQLTESIVEALTKSDDTKRKWRKLSKLVTPLD